MAVGSRRSGELHMATDLLVWNCVTIGCKAAGNADNAMSSQFLRRRLNWIIPIASRIIAIAAIRIQPMKIPRAHSADNVTCAGEPWMTEDPWLMCGTNGSAAMASKAPNQTVNRAPECRRNALRDNQATAAIISPAGIELTARSVAI